MLVLRLFAVVVFLLTPLGAWAQSVGETGTPPSPTVLQGGTWTVQPGNTANTTPWEVTENPVTSGGLTTASGSIGATKTAIKASAGQIYCWAFFNSNTAAAYVQVFNLASASITLGTTAPTFSLGLPGGGGSNICTDEGIAFSTAITIAVTTTRTGSTGPASTVDYNIFYQ